MTDVTVIGLGQMGSTLAKLLLEAGKKVTVWNRTAERAEELRKQNAAVAAGVVEAIGASELIIICVYDYQAVDDILFSAEARAALKGKTVINLGTGSPEDAKRILTLVNRFSGAYLDGAIQAAPSQMGEGGNALVLISGSRQVFEKHKPVLDLLAGNWSYLGEPIDAAAYMDLATLSYVYGAFGGFLHGVRLAEKVGMDVQVFGKLVQGMSSSFGEFFAHEASVVKTGDFSITQSPMGISVAAVKRIVDVSQKLGLNTELPDVIDGWLDKATAQGYDNEELVALVKVLR